MLVLGGCYDAVDYTGANVACDEGRCPDDQICGTGDFCYDAGTFTCETDDNCNQKSGCKTCNAWHMCETATVVPAPGDLQQCSVFEDYGIFVRPDAQGDDSNDGTRAEPFKTLAKAVAAVQSQSFIGTPRIYACADVGDYDETLVLSGVSQAVELYGNVNCDGGIWTYASGARAAVAPQTAGDYALRIADSSGTITLEGFHFKSVDATAPGGSSIAGFVSDSPSVSMVRVDLTAGIGKKGKDGVQAADNYGGATALAGKAGGEGTLAAGGGSQSCGCVVGPGTTGGRGGRLGNPTPTNVPDPGDPGSATNDNAGTNGTADGTVACAATANASLGGTQGAHGANAATLGQLTQAGWLPASGGNSSNGTPGQGGGGGGAQEFSGTLYGGGGGGCGGCGGKGASGGQGGGASIALAVFQSGVTLDASCTLTAVLAGDGGNAEFGGDEQEGGTGGVGAGTPVRGCKGSAGADGGLGGHSGAGAGGVSAGIAYVGAEPNGAAEANITVSATVAARGSKAVGQNAPGGVSEKSWKAD